MRTSQVVRLAALEQERLVDQAQQLLAVLARVPAVRTSTPSGCVAFLSSILPLHPAFSNLAVVSQNGDVTCSATPLSGPLSVMDQDYFTQALQTKAFAVSRYQTGGTSGTPSITVAYPISDISSFNDQALVIASLDLAWLNRLLEATTVPEGGVLGVFDTDGTVLARFPDPGDWLSKAVPEAELTHTILGQGTGTAQVAGLDGVLRSYSFAPLTLLGEPRGYIYVGVPRGALVAASDAAFVRSTVWIGFFSLLALVVAYFASDRLVLRHLSMVVRATQRVAAGDLSARSGLRPGHGEIHQLAASFDSMAAALQQRDADHAASAEEVLRLNTELEQRVQQRTAQLESANWELAQREHELQDAKTLLEHLITASPVMLFRMDPDSRATVYASANADRITGYQSGDITSDPAFWDNVTLPADRPAVTAAYAAALQTHQPAVATEFRFRHQDGSERWAVMTSRIEYAPGGKAVSIVGALIDITDRKVAEAEVEQARIEADRANQAKSEFLSRMSHELRTPLNAILGFAQLLELDDLNDEQQEGVAQILKGGRHLLELINEVLDISRIEAGRLNLSPEPVQLAEVLHEALDLLRPLAADRNVTLNADLSGTAQRYITADRQRLKQVLLNLLSNAVKYNRPNGAVDVACTLEDGGRMRIAVKDTGIGIAPEHLGRVFSPFERLGADETAIEGTGLGLALSRRLVEAMDGTVGLTTERGVGSTFWLELPLAVSQDELAAPALADLPPAVNGHSAAATVLYIEDNLSNLRLIERLLARWPDVDLLTAMQGRLGLDLAWEHQPDVILLDLHLPDMLGDQVLQELRTDPRTQDTAVVMVSADATPGQVARLLSSGAQAYLTKPIDVKQFFDVLEQLLQERRK